MQTVSSSRDSMLASLAGFVSPLFSPLGFADWRITTSLLSGFMAKESVVSTLLVMFGSAAAMQPVLTLPAVFSLLVFCLLYTPCVAAIASIHRELGTRYAVAVVTMQCVVAWLVAYLTYVVICAVI